MARTDEYPNRVKRKSCKKCGGLGTWIEKQKIKVRQRNRDGSIDVITETDKQRVKCNRCKGSGMELW